MAIQFRIVGDRTVWTFAGYVPNVLGIKVVRGVASWARRNPRTGKMGRVQEYQTSARLDDVEIVADCAVKVTELVEGA